MKKQHPAHWECEWITANSHRYQNPLPDEQIKRRIITRSSFQRGQLLRDPTLFSTSDGWLAEQHGYDESSYIPYITKSVRIIDVNLDPECPGGIQLAFVNSRQTFKEYVQQCKDYGWRYHYSLDKLLKHYRIDKEYSINKATIQILEEEVGDGAVYFSYREDWGLVVEVVFQIEQITAIYQITIEE